MTKTQDIYVTNTETEYADSSDKVFVRLYGRDSEGNAAQAPPIEFEPFFLIRAEDRDKFTPVEVEDIVRIEDTTVQTLTGEHTPDGLERDDLVKVVARSPKAVSNLKDRYDKTWNADVWFTNLFRIEEDVKTGVRVPDQRAPITTDDVEPVEMTDMEPRVVTFDIETDDRGAGFPEPGDARVLSIVAHDSYDDEYVGFIDLNGRSAEEAFDQSLEGVDHPHDLGLDELDKLNFEGDEKRMFIRFALWMDEKDPDIVTAWNGGGVGAKDAGFDLPHLIERMKKVGASPNRLARDGNAYVNNWGDVTLDGRTPYDMMYAWESTKFTDPRSLKLDHAADVELDDAKLEHPGIGFYDLYNEDTTKFLNYNAKDTRLTVEVNEAANVLGFKTTLRNTIGLDYEETVDNNEFVEMLIRRKLHEKGLAGITASQNEDVIEAREKWGKDEVKYEGAKVFDAFTGLKENVIGKDLASLYPMTMWMLNASPETKIEKEYAEEHDIPYIEASNGICFRQDFDGIFKELVDEALELKAEAKQKRNAAPAGSLEQAMWAERYNVRKTIVNSIYGVLGWDKFFLYDADIAAAVTITGQKVISATAEYINEETVADVVYGDTDSNYCEYPSDLSQEESLRTAQEICDHLNDEVYPKLAEELGIPTEKNRWVIEIEMFAKRFFQSGSKKQYAYLATWKEGMALDESLDEGKFSVTGYHCVKSNFSLFTKEWQEQILEAIVRGASNEEVADMMFEAANSLDPDDPDWEYIGIPGGMKKRINPDCRTDHQDDCDDCFSWSKTGDHPQGAQPRAAYFSNLYLPGVQYGKGSKPMRVNLRNTYFEGREVDVLAYEYERDLEPVMDQLTLDIQATQDKILRNPMEDILDAIGMDVDAAICGQQQSGLGAFM